MENDFSALLDELAALQTSGEEMAKAMTAEASEDDKKIAAAADTDGDGKVEGAKEDADGDGAEGEGNKEAEYLGKSFGVTLEDGSVVQAYDGTEAIRLLNARLDKVGADIGETMSKALSAVTAAMKGQQTLIAQQSEMMKALRAEVASLRHAGAGRRAALTVHERTVEPPKPEGIAPAELMSKALTAQQAGKITAREVARIEAHVGRGLQPPADLLSKIA